MLTQHISGELSEENSHVSGFHSEMGLLEDLSLE